MAYELIRQDHNLPIVAGSTVLPQTAVKLAGTSSLFVLPVATMSDEPFGMVDATAGASGLAANEAVTVYERFNIKKAVAAASLGVNTLVAIGSVNGAMWPVSAASLFAASGHWTVGKSMTPAGPGEVFSLYIEPRKA